MGKTINKSVQFELLPSNEVLVSVTVSAGEPGKSDITTVARQRIDCGEFCSKAFPIMYQNFKSWPPNDPDMENLKKQGQLDSNTGKAIVDPNKLKIIQPPPPPRRQQD